MLDEYLHRDDRDNAKLVDYGDLAGNGALYKSPATCWSEPTRDPALSWERAAPGGPAELS